MNVHHPIPYQGSKRRLAPLLCQCVPSDVLRIVEPFAGSAAFSLAASAHGLATRFVLGDLHRPLVDLWQDILRSPVGLADGYEALWHEQAGRERAFYDEVRARFNRTHAPPLFLYLLARCVKAAIRYNSKGEFNNSPDNRRRGARPELMRRHLLGASRLLKSGTIRCADFRAVADEATPADLLYLDPPYQGVQRDRDARYIGGVGFGEFCDAIEAWNRRGLSFLISYDGRSGDKTYGDDLPASLGLQRHEVAAGRSTQATLLGREDQTVESLYLSRALLARLGGTPAVLTRPSTKATRIATQPTLFAGVA